MSERAGVPLWESMSRDEVVRFAARDPVAVLPLAAIEQHGPHLPLSTDLEIGGGVLAAAFRSLQDDPPARVLPAQAVGASLEHARHPGTLSLPSELLGEVIVAVGASLARHGIRRLLLANTHGGNEHVLDAAGLRLREAHAMLVVKATVFRLPRPEGTGLPEAEWKHGLHGGAVETSMLLYLRPDLVRMDRAAAARSLGEELETSLDRLGPEEPGASFSWLAGDLHPSGIVGDPQRARAELGARLVEHYGALLAEAIHDACRFPVERLDPEGAGGADAR